MKYFKTVITITNFVIVIIITFILLVLSSNVSFERIVEIVHEGLKLNSVGLKQNEGESYKLVVVFMKLLGTNIAIYFAVFCISGDLYVKFYLSGGRLF